MRSEIKKDSTVGNDTKKLNVITYEEYLNKYVDVEYNTTSIKNL